MKKSIKLSRIARQTGAAITGILAAGITVALAQQQQPQIDALESVAAVVNDKVISTFDVRQRVQLIALTSGGRIPDEAMAQLQQKALRDLIEEELKLAEANELEFDIDPAEVDQEIVSIAAGAGNTPEQLARDLAEAGISMEAVRRQIHTRLMWESLVGARYGSRISISEREIDDIMNRMRADSRDEQFLVSEICLPVRDNMNIASIEQAGAQIIQQMQQGVPFETMARQFSVCTSAAAGGDMGWLRAGELDPEIGNIIRQLNQGAISRPIMHDGTLKIMAVRQKRAAAQQGTKAYELGYASAPGDLSETRANEIFSKLPQSNICRGDALAVDLGENVGFELLPMLPASALEPPFRAPVEQLDRLEVSQAIRNGDSWHAMLLCSKDEGLGLPSRTQIENRLYAQELELLARRYLRDIEREASIQIRLGSPDRQG